MRKRKEFAKSVVNKGNDRPLPSFNNIKFPPSITDVVFKHGTSGSNCFRFDPWYGLGIDEITHACQQQIERFLNKQEAEVEQTTVYAYCRKGLRGFLEYLSILSGALHRPLAPEDINRNVIDGYLGFLRDGGTSIPSQRSCYASTKAVLKALCRRGLISETIGGENATFPRNPFPGAHRTVKGAHPLPKSQRDAFSRAVKTAVMPIFTDDAEPTSDVLAYALLIIALHTGRNTWPLLEMTSNCLRPHPKDETLFLVLHKRRSHSTSKVAIRADMDRTGGIDAIPTIRPTVARLISRVIELSKRLQHEAPEHLRDRIWLYRMRAAGRAVGGVGIVSALTEDTLRAATKKLIANHNLKDAEGCPLRINVSRLRKTFINRVYEILEGDVVSTAVAAVNSAGVLARHYLRPDEHVKKNWRFMGMTLVGELLTSTVGATERTPVGRCTDNKSGQFAPKRDGATCMSFLNCLRCSNYVVTGQDLYRLFSFYWRLLSERGQMNPTRWKRQFAHIVRLIERDVIEVGIKNGIFRKVDVDRERERARHEPHPFWKFETLHHTSLVRIMK